MPISCRTRAVCNAGKAQIRQHLDELGQVAPCLLLQRPYVRKIVFAALGAGIMHAAPTVRTADALSAVIFEKSFDLNPLDFGFAEFCS
jgi:hypothetical protein